MAKRKRKKACKNHSNPNAKVIETDEQLFKYLDQYIEEEGFATDAKSFGQTSSSWSGSSESSPVPNEYTYHVLVSITGFNQWLERGHNYTRRLINEFENDTNGALNARVREKLLAHNYKGLSLEHISNKAFDFWKMQTFGREELDFKRELNKIKLRQEELKLKQMEMLASKIEDENVKGKLDVNAFEAISAIMSSTGKD